MHYIATPRGVFCMGVTCIILQVHSLCPYRHFMKCYIIGTALVEALQVCQCVYVYTSEVAFKSSLESSFMHTFGPL